MIRITTVFLLFILPVLQGNAQTAYEGGSGDGYAMTSIDRISGIGDHRPGLDIEVYPNPVAKDGELTVVIPASMDYRMIDISGRVVSEGSLNGRGHWTISTTGLVPGIYCLHTGGATHLIIITDP